MPATEYNVYSLLVGKDRGQDRAGTTVVITVASRGFLGGVTGPGRGFFSGEVSGMPGVAGEGSKNKQR